MRYFFYGTLMDTDILRLVLGRAVAARELKPARLAGFRRVRADGASFPILRQELDCEVSGCILENVNAEEARRLARYEGKGYDLLEREVTLEEASRKLPALVFLSNHRIPGTSEAWDLRTWQSRDKAGFIASHFPSAGSPAEIRLIAREVPFQGFFRVARYRLRHRLYAGGMGGEIAREVFERGHAVSVLPYDPIRDAVVLIEQFRAGAYAAGRPAWLVETIAGMIKPDEAAEEVARREALEEADCRLIGPLEHVAGYFASPGGSDEHVDVYVGCCDSGGLGGVHGLPEEHEDIKVIVLPFEEALSLIAKGGIHASPPIIALLWLAKERHRLRQAWSARLRAAGD